MYKINIRQSDLILLDDKEILFFSKSDPSLLIAKYHGKRGLLLNYIDMLEKSSERRTVLIVSNDLDKLKDDFKDMFKTIKASGGLVFNEMEEVLFIFRRGWWDLPKGKIEVGESKREAAIREVEEETGVSDLVIVEKLGKTRHMYKNKKGHRIIKISYWYKMTTHNQPLVPQIEEDIVKAEWMPLGQFRKLNYRIYPSLKSLIAAKYEDFN